MELLQRGRGVGVDTRGRRVEGVVTRGRVVDGVVTRGRLVVSALGVDFAVGAVSRRTVGSKKNKGLLAIKWFRKKLKHLLSHLFYFPLLNDHKMKSFRPRSF